MAVELAYDDVGSGPVVVLLHAFPCDASMWQRQRDSLAAAGWRVVTPDLRGFGRSPLGDDPPSVDRMAEDVHDLLRRLDVDRYVLGGLSMGGYVTMAMLRRAPRPVAGVVLADTKAAADPPAAAENRERMAAEVVAAGSAGPTLRTAVLPALLGATTVATRPDVVERVTGYVDAAPAATVAWAQRAMAARPDSFDLLTSLTVPTLVLYGAEDALSPRADQDAMAQRLARGTLVEVPGVGHLSAVEDPDAVSRALVDFLAPLRPPYV
ncbi:MAG: alpha/beta hydrolase [Candidatus Nanopelagicales bacterium]